MIAVLLAGDPQTAPVVFELECETATGLPVQIRIPIDTPDGPQHEVWQQADWLHPFVVTYRLQRIETDE